MSAASIKKMFSHLGKNGILSKPWNWIKQLGEKKKKSIKSTLTYLQALIFILFIFVYYFSSLINANLSGKAQIRSYHSTLTYYKQETVKNAVIMGIKLMDANYESCQEELRLVGSDLQVRAQVVERHKNEFIRQLRSINTDDMAFYLFESDGMLLVNTDNSSYEGVNRLDMEDAEGVRYFEQLLPLSKKGGGYVNTHEIVGKRESYNLYYGSYFEKWDQILIASSSMAEMFDYEQAQVMMSKKWQRIQILTALILAVFFLIGGVFIIGYVTERIFIRPIQMLIEKTREISDGDLTVKFDLQLNNEFGEMIKAFILMVDKLRELNTKIFNAVIMLDHNMRGLYSSSSIVHEQAQAQASTLSATSDNFNQLNAMMERIVENSQKSEMFAAAAIGKVDGGLNYMENLDKEMQRIESSSVQIANIISMMNDIAEQTNLLALNASIESARAGEAGRGFNIVSGEIRKLAAKSTEAANKIRELITSNNELIAVGVKYTKEVTGSLQDISDATQQISGLVKTITSEITGVSEKSESITKAFSQVSEAARGNMRTIDNVQDILQNFVSQTIDLQRFVGQFDVRSDKEKEIQVHIENLLKVKLKEAEEILKTYGDRFLPTGNIKKIGEFSLQEMLLGEEIVTGDSKIVDEISAKIHSSVTLMQPSDDCLVRVATTVRNFDDTRAVGTLIGSDSKVYKRVMEDGEIYYGRAFVINRRYVAVYKPIKDETGFVAMVLYIGIPEQEKIEE